MRKYRKTFDASKIKINFSYSVTDIVEKLGVTKGTVYAWVKEGLRPIDNRPPFLFHGSVLRAFLKKRQDDRKQKCKAGEMFCFKCQLARRPLEGKTSLTTTKGSNPNLTANCAICNAQMFKAVSADNLPKTLKTFQQEVAHNSHLIECPPTTSNHNNNIGA